MHLNFNQLKFPMALANAFYFINDLVLLQWDFLYLTVPGGFCSFVYFCNRNAYYKLRFCFLTIFCLSILTVGSKQQTYNEIAFIRIKEEENFKPLRIVKYSL